MSRINNKECFITGYDVNVVDDGNGDLLLTVVDGCNSLTNQHLLKTVITLALTQWMTDNGATDAELAALCPPADCNCCCKGPADLAITFSSKSAVYPSGSTTAPVAPGDDVTVALPVA